MTSPIVIPRVRFFTKTGVPVPLAGGKVHTYIAGTTTPLATYTDSTGSTPNTNPIVLDAYGEATIWLGDSTSYKFVVKDASDVTQWTEDNISSVVKLSGATTDALRADLASAADAAKGAAMVGFDEDLNYPADTVGAALAEAIQNQPVATPFGVLHGRTLLAEEGKYFGLNIGLFQTTANFSNAWAMVWREATRHGVENATKIMAAVSRDRLQSLDAPVVAYHQSDVDTRNFAVASFASGRLGIVASRRQADLTYQAPIFLYSDDTGATWSIVTLPTHASVTSYDFHGHILQYPASVGGHDTNGFIVYLYGLKSGQSVLHAYTTVDNGATWTLHQDVLTLSGGPGGLTGIVEPAVIRMGTQQKWLLVARSSGISNAVVSTSTNMLTWTTVADSGFYMAGNPPELIDYRGRIALLTFFRRGRSNIANTEDSLCVRFLEYDGNPVGGWTDWYRVASGVNLMTGYPAVANDQDRLFIAFTQGEYDGASAENRGARLSILSPEPGFAADAYRTLPVQPNILNNGDLHIWSRGVSAASATVRGFTADCWHLGRSSSRPYSWSRIGGDKSYFALRCQRPAGDTFANPMYLVQALTVAETEPLRDKWVTFAVRMRKGGDFSETSGSVTIAIYSTTTGGQVSYTAANGLFATDTTQIASKVCAPSTLWRDFKLSALIPADSDQIQVVLFAAVFSTSAAGANDYFDIERPKLDMSRDGTTFIPEHPAVADVRCKRRFFTTYDETAPGTASTTSGQLKARARGTEAATAIALNVRFPVKMVSTPTVTIYNPSTGGTGTMRNITASTNLNATSTDTTRDGTVIENSAATTSGDTYGVHMTASADV